MGLFTHRVRTVTSVQVVLLLLVVALLTFSVSVGGAAGAPLYEELYNDLGVAPTATKADIRKAFRKLTREHHPDLKESFDEKEAAKVEMARVLRAYEVLSNDDHRAEYDLNGVIPGEAPNVREQSAEEIFRHYHQNSPIFSKSTTLETPRQLHRMQRFRGGRLFLVEVYDDASKACRSFSNAWETLYHSGLVDAGILEMYRIDAGTAEGEDLVKELKIRYKNSPYVFAIIDGETWTLHGMSDLLKGKNDRRTFQALLDFVMAFFYDVYTQTTSLEVTHTDDIVNYLRAPRTAAKPVRVLFPPITAESIPVAVDMRYDQVETRTVPRDELLSFVQDYCEMEVDVKDRYGESLPMPEFMVVSTEALPDETDTGVGADGSSDGEEGGHGERGPFRSCRAIHIGASSALNYEKTAKFLSTQLPPRRPGMSEATYIDAMSFYDVCAANCVLWVRSTCAASSEAEVAQAEHIAKELLQPFYEKFKTGYLCLDEQSELRTKLPELATAVEASGDAPTLVALTGGDDKKLYRFPSDPSRGPLTTKEVETVLSDLLLGIPPQNVASTETEGHLGTLLHSTPFPMSQRQRYYLLLMVGFKFVQPFINNTAPFFIMWLIHKKVLNRNQGDGDGNNANTSAGANASGSSTNATSGAAGAAAAPARPPGPPQVTLFGQKDIDAAKEGKGFLVVVLDEREMLSGPLPLPKVAMDPRFTVRILGPEDSKWVAWMKKHKPTKETAANDGSVAKAEKGLSVLAIRKQRMKAIVKADGELLDDFLRDLLDGTKTARLELPSWVSM